MPFVLDASMAMSWCFADERTSYSARVLSSLSGSYAEVPALWQVEVANVLAANERRQRITSQGSDEFLSALAELDIRMESFLPSTNSKTLLALTRRHGLTAYDATYLELAKRKGLPIASFDRDLLRAASLEGVAIALGGEG